MSEINIQTDKVMIEKLQFAAMTHLSASMAQSLRVDTFQDEIFDHLICRVTTDVHAQQIAKGTVTESRDVVVETPATTWQMFKQRHALSWWLRWLVRRRPVRMQEHRRQVTLTATWTGHATFPDSSLVLSDERFGSPVYRLVRDTEWQETAP